MEAEAEVRAAQMAGSCPGRGHLSYWERLRDGRPRSHHRDASPNLSAYVRRPRKLNENEDVATASRKVSNVRRRSCAEKFNDVDNVAIANGKLRNVRNHSTAKSSGKTVNASKSTALSMTPRRSRKTKETRFRRRAGSMPCGSTVTSAGEAHVERVHLATRRLLSLAAS